MDWTDPETLKMLGDLKAQAEKAHDKLQEVLNSYKCPLCGEVAKLTRNKIASSALLHCPNYNPITGKNHFHQIILADEQ